MTISEVSSSSRESMSRWWLVISDSTFSARRSGMRRKITIATPERMAPATKYGGNRVECQPGTIDMAKSHDTTLCTETTSGVAKAASNR